MLIDVSTPFASHPFAPTALVGVFFTTLIFLKTIDVLMDPGYNKHKLVRSRGSIR